MTGSCEGGEPCPWKQIDGGKLRGGTHVANQNKQTVQRSVMVTICCILQICKNIFLGFIQVIQFFNVTKNNPFVTILVYYTYNVCVSLSNLFIYVLFFVCFDCVFLCFVSFFVLVVFLLSEK